MQDYISQRQRSAAFAIVSMSKPLYKVSTSYGLQCTLFCSSLKIYRTVYGFIHHSVYSVLYITVYNVE